MVRIVVFLIFCGLSVNVLAEEPKPYFTRSVDIKTGYLTGEIYLNLPETHQEAYVMGIVDGIFLAPLWGAEKSQLNPVEACLEQMSSSQVMAILTKYLRDRPHTWHQGAHTHFFVAIIDACNLTQNDVGGVD